MIKKYKTTITVISILIIALVVTNTIFVTTIHSKSPEKKIKFGERKNISLLVSDGYYEKLKSDSLNIDYHFEFIDNHFYSSGGWSYYKNLPKIISDQNILDYYKAKSESVNTEVSDIGNFGLGLYYYYNNFFEKSIIFYKKVNNTRLKYLNSCIGMIFLKTGKTEEAETYFTKEIELENGNKKHGYKGLIYLYTNSGQREKLLGLLNNPESKVHFTPQQKKQLYFEEKSITPYFISLVMLIFTQIDIIGLLAAFLVMLTWLFYLRRLDIYEKERLWIVILTLVLGMLFSIAVFWLSDINKRHFGFGLNGGFFNDLIYSIVGIGAIEELVKIVPLLLILTFTKGINEPYDYILYASTSALGFAFIENLIYFDGTQINIIHARALTAVVGHMFDSSVIAYGLILARYKYKNLSSVAAFFIFFGLASIVHGLYDFWIFHSTFIIFVLFFLMCVRIWITFIKNALNNSSFFSYDVKMRNDNLRYILVISLTGILVFEYLLTSIDYGAYIANKSLYHASITGSFLIIFLGTKLSRIQLAKSYWNPIKVSLLPPKLGSIDSREFVGDAVSIRAFPSRSNQTVKSAIPYYITGRIIDRINLENQKDWPVKKPYQSMIRSPFRQKDDPHWLLVKLNEEIKINHHVKDHVFIKFKRLLDYKSGTKALFQLLIFPDMQNISSKKIVTKDFKIIGYTLVEEIDDVKL